MQQGRQRLTAEQLAAVIGGCSGRDEVGLVTLAGDEDVSLMSASGEQIRQPRGGTVQTTCLGCAAMGQIGVVGEGVTSRRELSDHLELLSMCHAHLDGVVLARKK